MSSGADRDFEIRLKRPFAMHVMMILLTGGLGITAFFVPRKNDNIVPLVVATLLILVGIFFVWSMAMLARRARFALRATEKWLEVPGPAWSPDLQRIEWSRVTDISRRDDGALRVGLDSGQVMAYPESWFESSEAAREACFALKERMALAHQRLGKQR